MSDPPRIVTGSVHSATANSVRHSSVSSTRTRGSSAPVDDDSNTQLPGSPNNENLTRQAHTVVINSPQMVSAMAGEGWLKDIDGDAHVFVTSPSATTSYHSAPSHTRSRFGVHFLVVLDLN